MAAHTTGQLSADHGAPLVDFDGVLTAAKGVLDHALHLEKIALAHVFEIRKNARETRRTLARPERERKMTHAPASVQPSPADSGDPATRLAMRHDFRLERVARGGRFG